MITLQHVYLLVGSLFVVFAYLSARDATNPKRWTTGLFWGLFATSFLAGDYLGDLANGVLVLVLVLVLVMALIAGADGLGVGKPATTTHEERQASSARWGNALFMPALVIPLVTLAGTFAIKGLPWPIVIDPILINGVPLGDPKQATLIALAIGAVIAAVLAVVMTRQPLASPFHEGRRLMDVISWAALLPQMLASLGAVFAVAGVGKVVGDLATRRPTA